MRAILKAAIAAAVLVSGSLVAGCAEPPSKEMHQAQGAIDAARAAGADRYAPEEYEAAVNALKRSEDAAAQRDYRLALNNALDSRERAQNAAREAASARAQARSQAERTLAEVTTALAAATSTLEAATAAKVPAHALAGSREAIAAAQRSVQEAGTALGREDYLGAQKVLASQAAALGAARAHIHGLLASLPARASKKSR